MGFANHQSNIIAHIYNPDNQTKSELLNGFVAREILFKRLYDDIKCKQAEFPIQHFIIEGRRGMGKTSLLLYVKYNIEDDPDLNTWLIPLFMKEEGYGVTSLFRFWEKIAQYLAEYDPSFDGLQEQMEALYDTCADKAQYGDAIFELLRQALLQRNKKLLLLVDNFNEYVRKFKPQEVQRFRSILQTYKEIGIVAATATVMEELHEYKHPFYEFFKVRRLNGLNKEDTYKLLRKLGETYKMENIEYILREKPQKVETLRRLTGGVIRTVVLMYEIFAEDSDGTTFSNLEALLDRVTPLYKHIMDELPAQQQEIVDALAFGWEALSVKQLAENTRLESKAISAQLATLCKNQMVEKVETNTKNHLYRIEERFLNIWYLMRFGRKGDKNAVLWLTKILEEWCDKEELVSRAKKYINDLKLGNYHEKGVLYMTPAFANSKYIDKELQHELLEITSDFARKKGIKDLAETLQKSDLSLAKEAAALYEASNDYKIILKTLLEVTENNQDNFGIGIIYNEIEDYKKAEKYYLKAINTGNNDALNNLANLYCTEYKDYKKAKTYYLRAIETGNNDALYNLALLYESELKDYKKAEEYYLKAIETGIKNALFNLALLYRYGFKDFKKAETYYLKAIEAGVNQAFNNLANLYKNEYKDFEKAEAYYLKAIDAGVNQALNNLALLYENEYKNYEKAEAYYLKAIETGDNGTLYNLAKLYNEEYKDYKKAEAYYLKAIETGDNKALNNLANLYENEYKDFEKAKVLYEKEIAKDNKAAFNGYAWLLFEHFTNEKENALLYAQKAVENEANIHTLHTLACIQLWNNQPEAAFETANQFLYDEKSIEDFDNDYQTFLLLAIAKKQYAFVYDYFMGERGKKIQSKDRFKPIWYALMHYMREEHPIEYLRMGSELKETVEEIIVKIDEMSVKYA